MLKRAVIALFAFIAIFFLGSALVGYHVISANAGIAVWLVGIICAVVVFIKTKPKAN